MTDNYQLYLSMWMANSIQNNNLISKADIIKLNICKYFLAQSNCESDARNIRGRKSPRKRIVLKFIPRGICDAV